jgi:3',5'-nucleoside bisphosphate phosphatase
MNLSYNNLVLEPNQMIDLQLHTTYSDGQWTAEDLLDYLIANQFGLAAITDHDRVDIQVSLQKLAITKQFPLLVAVEMSSMWKGKLTDFLCYGFDTENNTLDMLAKDVTHRQHENTRQIFEYLVSQGYPLDEATLQAMLAKSAAQQLPELLALVAKYPRDEKFERHPLLEAGFGYMTHSPAAIVEAAHQSDAVCILAHPGRADGFVCYDRTLLDELRTEANIDGIEAYYPLHTPEQTAFYLDYAAQHGLLVSSGSDSHSIEKPPIPYRAELSQQLLERLGITITT